MTLRIPAKVLLHVVINYKMYCLPITQCWVYLCNKIILFYSILFVWSYDFYDMTLSTGKQRSHMINIYINKEEWEE